MDRRVNIMPYPQFDRRQLEIKPLSDRVHDMTLDHLLQLEDPVPPVDDPALPKIAERIVRARKAGRPVILLMGGHVIKQGLSRQVIDLMERGLLTHIAMNGSGPIHDYELALIGKTTESVARYITEANSDSGRRPGASMTSSSPETAMGWAWAKQSDARSRPTHCGTAT